MVAFNRVILAGNLVRDPETRFIPSGTAVTEFAIAVNSRYRSKATNEVKEDVSYFDIVVFGKMGENCAEYLSKGRPVLVEGRLRQRRWEADGVKRNKIEILADNVQFLGGPRGSSAEGAPASAPATEAPDDDIPF
ncbi:MAG: single-stranded DNA-binding protein [Deltaproteobacteria bacterium]|nr:MAG: single-stranded DNA-binding protein [Deltaproteobacteria bacterium]